MAEDNSGPTVPHLRKATQLAELRRIANHSDNMLAAWEALSLQLGGKAASNSGDMDAVGDGDMVEIPAWCAAYLLRAALNIAELRNQLFVRKDGLNPKELLDQLPSALELSGSGWNAFARAMSTWDSMQDFRIFQNARDRGMSSAEATEEVRVFRGLADPRSAARRISKGRKLEEALVKPIP